MSGAFGNEGRKQALLKEIQSGGPIYKSWLTYEGIEADHSPVARDFELHPAFVSIMPILGNYGQGEARAFYVSAINAIPVGADLANALRHWFLFAWDEPTCGISSTLKGTPMMEHAQEIIGLVRKSLTTPIDKATWRAARNRFTAAQTAAGVDVEQIDGVLAMAWNLDQTPGAAGDVVNSWSLPIYAAARGGGDQLTEEENATVGEHMEKAHAAAVAELGELTKDEEGRAAYERATLAYWATVPKAAAIYDRMKAQWAGVEAKVGAWRALAQKGFIETLAAAPVNATA